MYIGSDTHRSYIIQSEFFFSFKNRFARLPTLPPNGERFPCTEKGGVFFKRGLALRENDDFSMYGTYNII